MPIVRFEMLEGRTLEQKRDLVRGLTDSAAKALGCSTSHIQVVIHETSAENWATSGDLVCDQRQKA